MSRKMLYLSIDFIIFKMKSVFLNACDVLSLFTYFRFDEINDQMVYKIPKNTVPIS